MNTVGTGRNFRWKSADAGTWEADQKSDESMVSYVMSTQQTLKEMAECVKENMLEKQLRYAETFV